MAVEILLCSGLGFGPLPRAESGEGSAAEQRCAARYGGARRADLRGRLPDATEATELLAGLRELGGVGRVVAGLFNEGLQILAGPLFPVQAEVQSAPPVEEEGLAGGVVSGGHLRERWAHGAQCFGGLCGPARGHVGAVGLEHFGSPHRGGRGAVGADLVRADLLAERRGSTNQDGRQRECAADHGAAVP